MRRNRRPLTIDRPSARTTSRVTQCKKSIQLKKRELIGDLSRSFWWHCVVRHTNEYRDPIIVAHVQQLNV